MTYRAEDWKAGDVALIPFSRGGVRAMYTGDGWVTCDRTPVRAVADYINMRRLVVIDAEDREQVERLASIYASATSGELNDYPLTVAALHMQAALREFATPTPPRPDEPTGLGAVVEDAEGVLWVQFNSVTGKWWRNHQGKNRRWSEIAAVKVLSAGVPNE